MRRLVASVVVLIVASTAACKGDVFVPASTGATAGAGGRGGAVGDGGRGGQQSGGATSGGKAGMGGNPPMPMSCAIRYVSPTGAVTNSGCEPGAPLPSIAMAVNRSTLDPLGSEIRVCTGDYAEPALVIEKPLKLFGSVPCETFTLRTSDTIAETDRTIVRPLPVSTEGATLLLAESLGQTLVLDGFRVLGRDANASASFAVQVGATGTVQIVASELLAGAGFGGQFASVGLFATSGQIVVSRSVVKAGAGRTDGKTKGFPAVGMYVASGVRASIERSTISGGAGVAKVKTEPVSIGLLVQDSVTGTKRPLTITASTVDAGAAACSFPEGCEGYGLRIGGGVDTTIDETTIRGATLLGAATTNDFPARSSVALETGLGSLILRRSRLYGGDVTMGTTIGLRLFDETVSIENTIVHGGGLDGDAWATRGLIQTGGALTVRNTTLLAGRRAPGSTVASVGIALSGVASPQILHDILFTEAPNDLTLTLETCAGPQTPTLIGNVFLPAGGPTPFVGGACAPNGVANLEALAAKLGAANVLENRRVTAVAASGSDFPFPPCMSATCAPAFFEGWSTATQGEENVIGPTLALPPRGITCPAIKSARTGPTVDLQGNPRPLGKLVAGATQIPCP